MLNFGHFWASPSSRCPGPPEILANFGPPSQRCPAGSIATQCPLSLVSSYRNKTTKKDTGGQTIQSVFFGENVAGRRPATFSQKHGLCPFWCLVVQVFTWFRVFKCLGVQVFKCLGCLGCLGCCVQVFTCHDIPGGSPKMAKISGRVKPDIFKRAAQKWPKFRVG